MEFIYEANRIYINDEEGKMIAEITFPLIISDFISPSVTRVSPIIIIISPFIHK